MTVGGMHTVRNRKNILSRSVRDWSSYAKQSKGKKIWFGNTEKSTCSQCKRGMKKSLADAQIKNKRENAPICIPCCQGRPRRPLQENIDRYTHMRRIKNEISQGIRKPIKKQNLKEIEELFNR